MCSIPDRQSHGGQLAAGRREHRGRCRPRCTEHRLRGPYCRDPGATARAQGGVNAPSSRLRRDGCHATCQLRSDVPSAIRPLITERWLRAICRGSGSTELIPAPRCIPSSCPPVARERPAPLTGVRRSTHAAGSRGSIGGPKMQRAVTLPRRRRHQRSTARARRTETAPMRCRVRGLGPWAGAGGSCRSLQRPARTRPGC